MAKEITIDKLTIGNKLTSREVDSTDIFVDGISIKEALKKIPATFVKTVNNIGPDEAGNVNISASSINHGNSICYGIVQHDNHIFMFSDGIYDITDGKYIKLINDFIPSVYDITSDGFLIVAGFDTQLGKSMIYRYVNSEFKKVITNIFSQDIGPLCGIQIGKTKVVAYKEDIKSVLYSSDSGATWQKKTLTNNTNLINQLINASTEELSRQGLYLCNVKFHKDYFYLGCWGTYVDEARTYSIVIRTKDFESYQILDDTGYPNAIFKNSKRPKTLPDITSMAHWHTIHSANDVLLIGATSGGNAGIMRSTNGVDFEPVNLNEAKTECLVTRVSNNAIYYDSQSGNIIANDRLHKSMLYSTDKGITWKTAESECDVMLPNSSSNILGIFSLSRPIITRYKNYLVLISGGYHNYSLYDSDKSQTSQNSIMYSEDNGLSWKQIPSYIYGIGLFKKDEKLYMAGYGGIYLIDIENKNIKIEVPTNYDVIIENTENVSKYCSTPVSYFAFRNEIDKILNTFTFDGANRITGFKMLDIKTYTERTIKLSNGQFVIS